MGQQRTANNRRNRAARNAIGRSRAAAGIVAAAAAPAATPDVMPKRTAP